MAALQEYLTGAAEDAEWIVALCERVRIVVTMSMRFQKSLALPPVMMVSILQGKVLFVKYYALIGEMFISKSGYFRPCLALAVRNEGKPGDCHICLASRSAR